VSAQLELNNSAPQTVQSVMEGAELIRIADAHRDGGKDFIIRAG
jgi:hypothetical protein